MAILIECICMIKASFNTSTTQLLHGSVDNE